MERALGRLDGVEHSEAQIGALQVQITPRVDRTLDLGAIMPALRREGIRPTGMSIVAKGRVERTPSGSTFCIDGWPAAFPVLGGEADEGEGLFRATVLFKDGTARVDGLERK